MSRKTTQLAATVSLLVLSLSAWSGDAAAQDACPNRGQLDTMYCDANGDLVADARELIAALGGTESIRDLSLATLAQKLSPARRDD